MALDHVFIDNDNFDALLAALLLVSGRAPVDVAPIQVPSTEADLWAPGEIDTVRYKVKFLVVNDGSAAVTVTIGRDPDDSGSDIGRPEFWMDSEVVPFPGTSGWRGPFDMHGDDAVRGVASLADNASVQWDVVRVDV